MTISIGVHAVTSNNFATTLTTAGITTQATGSRFLVAAFGKHSSPTVTDNKGNTYSLLANQAWNGTFGFSSLYECVNGVGGAGHTFSATMTGGDTIEVFAVEVLGSPTTGASAVAHANVSGTGSISSPAVTTTVAASRIVVFMGGLSSTVAAPTADTGSGFTFIDTMGTNLVGGSSSAAAATVGSYSDTMSFTTFSDLGGYTVAVPGSSAPAGAALAGAATDTTSGTAALITAIRLAANAADAISAAATFTTWATVTLVNPLFTGTGGILDPAFWLDNVPVAGDVIQYDATYITIATNGEIIATNNNISAVVQFNDGTGNSVGLVTITPGIVGRASDLTLATGDLGSAATAAVLAGAATDAVTASGALTVGSVLAGSALSLVTAAGALSTQINMLGVAFDSVSGQGNLTTRATLQGAGLDATTASAVLSTQIRLQGAAATLATATGGLTTAIKFLGNAIDASTASGALNAPAGLSGGATDATLASAVLSTQIRMAAAALDVVTATGALVTAIRLLGTAADTSSAAGVLSAGIPLAGNATDTTAASGAILVRALFVGAAFDVTQAGGDLTTAIQLLAAATDTTLAVGTLTTDQSPSGLYESEPGFMVGMRQYTTPMLPLVGTIEAHVITFDFTDELNSDERLQGVVSVTVVASAGTDANPIAILNGQISYDNAFGQVLVPEAGGVAGCDYYFSVSAHTTNPKKILARYALLQVRNG